MRVDEGEGWEHEVRAAFGSKRRIRLHFQGVGAPPMESCERQGSRAGNLFSICREWPFFWEADFAEVQRRSNALISGGGYSTPQLVFGSKLVNLLIGWGDRDVDLLFALAASSTDNLFNNGNRA